MQWKHFLPCSQYRSQLLADPAAAGVLPFVLAATEAEKHRLKALIAEGNPVDAVARLLVYVGKAQHRVEDSTFEALRNLLLAHPEVL
jgi:hypothetical protein